MGLALGWSPRLRRHAQRGGRQPPRLDDPARRAQEANPIVVTPGVLAGKKLYEDNCQKCHGKGGKGDGPDADPDDMPEDLSDRAAPRATRTA